jgi:hypothetical protein
MAAQYPAQPASAAMDNTTAINLTLAILNR